MKARWLAAALLVVAGCIPDHAPKVGRPTGEALAERRGLYLPQKSAGIALPGKTADATGTWVWPPESQLPGAGRRRSAALVLSGGGVRGAFQAGLITRMLTDEEFNDGHRVDHVFGVSVGALNGLLAGLAVSRVEAGADAEFPCPGCYVDPAELFGSDDPTAAPRYALRDLDAWTLWRVWAAMADYRWFQRKRTLVDFVIDGYLFDLRTLRLRLDQFVGDGDTLFLRARPHRFEAETEDETAFARACKVSGLHWPILHVGYVPYSTGVYRSVAYDPRREAEAACGEAGVDYSDAAGVIPPIVDMDGVGEDVLDWADTREAAVDACRAGLTTTGHPLSCATLTWLEASCPTPEHGPVSCTREGSDICCTDDVDAFKDATWASTAQPLLHNPVPIDPTAEGFRLRRDHEAWPDATDARERQVRARARLWMGRVNDREGLGNHYPSLRQSRMHAFQDREGVKNPRKNLYKAAPWSWQMEQGQLEWAIDGGVREVFPLLEALATGVDEIIVIGNVPPQRPECESSFAEDLPGPAARTYQIMTRSILEEMISEVYNDDLLVARHLLQSASLWNREKRWLVSYLAELAEAADAPAQAPDALAPAALASPTARPPTRRPSRELRDQLALLTSPCEVQTVSDARFVELVDEWLACGARDMDPAHRDVCLRAADLARPPRIGLEQWRSYPSAMARLRTVQIPDVRECIVANAASLRVDEVAAGPGYYRVPDVWVALPDRFPGDPLDQVHQDMVMLMRDGYHRADRMRRLLDYSPPDRCVEDTMCSSCGRGLP